MSPNKRQLLGQLGSQRKGYTRVSSKKYTFYIMITPPMLFCASFFFVIFNTFLKFEIFENLRFIFIFLYEFRN